MDGYSYASTQGQKVGELTRAWDAKAVEILIQLASDAKKIMDDPAYAGVGIDVVAEAYYKYSYLYYLNWDGTHTVTDEWLTVARATPAIIELYRVVNDALAQMNEIQNKQ